MKPLFFSRRKRNYFVDEKNRKRSSFRKWSVEHRIALSRAIGISLFLCVAIGGTVFVFLFSPWTRVTTFNVEGTQLVSKEEVINIAQEYISKRWFGIIPFNSFILFPEADIAASVEKAFPRLSYVTLTRAFPHEVNIRVHERTIKGIWCARTQSECAFFDSNGVIFGTAPSSTQGLLFFLVEDLRPYDAVLLGTQVLDVKTYTFLQELKNALAKADLSPIHFQIKNNEEIDLLFAGSSQSTWGAYFSSQYSPSYQVQILSRILDEDIGDKEPLLSYIDLRVKNKVFYKYKD